jgi:hypothetical protein
MLLYLPLVGVLSCEGGATSSLTLFASTLVRLLIISCVGMWVFLSVPFGAEENFAGQY